MIDREWVEVFPSGADRPRGHPTEKIAKLFPGADPESVGPLDVQLAILEALLRIEARLANVAVLAAGGDPGHAQRRPGGFMLNRGVHR